MVIVWILLIAMNTEGSNITVIDGFTSIEECALAGRTAQAELEKSIKSGWRWQPEVHTACIAQRRPASGPAEKP